MGSQSYKFVAVRCTHEGVREGGTGERRVQSSRPSLQVSIKVVFDLHLRLRIMHLHDGMILVKPNKVR